MDNLGFFDKNELSYILNNKKLFGERIIERVENYCLRKGWALDNIKNIKPHWELKSQRLDFQLEKEIIIVSKTEKAKKEDLNENVFILILISILLVFTIFHLLKNGGNNYFELTYVMYIGLPIVILSLIGCVKRNKALKIIVRAGFSC